MSTDQHWAIFEVVTTAVKTITPLHRYSIILTLSGKTVTQLVCYQRHTSNACRSVQNISGDGLVLTTSILCLHCTVVCASMVLLFGIELCIELYREVVFVPVFYLCCDLGA
eukprot:scpid35984/ scgid5113/ 